MYFLNNKTSEPKSLLHLQFVKNSISAKGNKMRYACIWIVYIKKKKKRGKCSDTFVMSTHSLMELSPS
jgi:hypothetical protein